MLICTLRMLRLLSVLRMDWRWHIVRMIRPMIRYLIRIIILIVWILAFLIILLKFFLMWSYVLLIINWISIRVIIVRRYTFITLRHSFVMLRILVVNFLIGLFIVFRIRLYVFRRIMWGMHWDWWIRIWIVMHSRVYFPLLSIFIFLMWSLIFNSSVIILLTTGATRRRWIR